MNTKTESLATGNYPAGIISACTTPVDGGFQVEIRYPNLKHPIHATVPTAGQALRLEYFHKRRYIHDKLSRWLRQRLYTLEVGERRKITAGAAKLKVELGQYADVSLAALCQLIARHRASIESVAPGMYSQFYAHYQREIVPLIIYCQNFKTE